MKRSLLQWIPRWFGMGCIVILLIFSIAGGYDSQAADHTTLKLPEPTGPYGIGTTLLHLTDPSRLEEITPDPNDHREIMVQIWYPAAKNTAGPTAAYTDARTAAQLIPEEPAIAETIITHAIDACRPAQEAEPFPLLVFSPGLGSVYALHQSLIENIVSHGYVLAAVNHPFVSGVTVFPDGRAIEMLDDESFEDKLQAMHAVVVEDIKFLTGQLESVKIGDATLTPDVNNIGILGHSFGGSAAIEAGLQLPQAKCAMDIDGSLNGESHQQPIHKPLFFMLQESFTPITASDLSTAWRNIAQDGYLMNLDGAEHLTFSDYGTLFYQYYGPDYLESTKEIFGDLGSIDPQKATRITNEYVVGFFDNSLKDGSPSDIAAIQHPEAALVQAGPPDEYEGIWRSNGYGFLMQIENGAVTAFEITQTGMLPVLQGQIQNHFLYVGDDIFTQFSQHENTLEMSGNNYDYTFEPVGTEALQPILESSDDPELNFEVFWQTFEEHCSLFDLVEADWKALYDEYRPRVSAETTSDELFDLLSSLIKPLNDGHTRIISSDLDRYSRSGPTPKALWYNDRAAHIENIAQYMDEGRLHAEANDIIGYGVIDGSIGYLNISAFGGFPGPDGETLPSWDFEEMPFEYAVSAVLEKIGNLDAMIIDLRFNDGGYDEAALALASRFIEEEITAYTKRVRIGGYDDFNAPMSRIIEPTHGASFTGKPVVLLTSDFTASAAEVFTMTMRQLDNVTLMGETTYGAFSDALPRHLPNGWEFYLSNERYEDMDGVDYEQQGISPDIEVIHSPTMLDEGKDSGLERGIKYIKEPNNPDDEGDDDDKDDEDDIYRISCFIRACMPSSF